MSRGSGFTSQPKDRSQHDPGYRQHGQHDDRRDRPRKLPLTLHYQRPEILHDDAEPVRSVKQNGEEDQQLRKAEEWILVELQRLVIKGRTVDDRGRFDDVDDQKKEDAQACSAMEHPRPHTLTSPIADRGRQTPIAYGFHLWHDSLPEELQRKEPRSSG